LREFTYAHSIAARRMKPVLLLTTFARGASSLAERSIHSGREDAANPVVGGVVLGRGLA